MGQGIDNEPISIEQTFNSTIDAIWNAITDPLRMKQWFFENIDSFRPEVSFETEFNVTSNGKDYLHIWEVSEVEKKQKISYSWRYGAYPGNLKVIWELIEQDNGTKLKLNHKGIESFPQDNPDFSRESCAEGWNFFIRQQLVEFVGENE